MHHDIPHVEIKAGDRFVFGRLIHNIQGRTNFMKFGDMSAQEAIEKMKGVDISASFYGIHEKAPATPATNNQSLAEAIAFSFAYVQHCDQHQYRRTEEREFACSHDEGYHHDVYELELPGSQRYAYDQANKLIAHYLIGMGKQHGARSNADPSVDASTD